MMGNFFTGSICKRSMEELKLIGDITSRKLELCMNGKSTEYSLCVDSTLESINRELSKEYRRRDPGRGLPRPPLDPLIQEDVADKKLSLEIKSPSILKEIRLSLGYFVPALLPPMYPENAEPELMKAGLSAKMRHIEVCINQPASNRFGQFLTSAQFAPAMIASSIQTKDVYAASPLLAPDKRFSSISSSTKYSDYSIESTLNNCLGKVSSGNYVIPETCPFGMTKEERSQFCWRLDLIEYDVVTGAGWKTFAQRVMHLNNSDLDMMDEFSCKYRYQVVEVLLDHWHKLYVMNSPKCILPVAKQTLIDVLEGMERLSLLNALGWEYSTSRANSLS